MEFNKKLILEDGQQYYGYSFGENCDAVCELVFNTSMVGYQEILSDLSYAGQAVVMTYPLIGNYGMAAEDYESITPAMGALVVREYQPEPSNFRAEESLGNVMKRFGIPGIWGVDTRKLTRSIRDFGSRKALLTNAGTALENGLRILESSAVPKDVVARVSCREIWVSPAKESRYNVVALDCGMKRNIVRSLNALGCNMTVVPWNTSSAKIESLRPDGVFLSNGPGDPADLPEVIETIRELKGKYPIFGICLGHQLLSLAYGASTYKLKFGHRGGNHPVKNLLNGKIEITSQNHSYAVEQGSLANTRLEVTHLNLLDSTVEGVQCREDRAFGVQYHPESAPGPQDSGYLFHRFLNLMEENKR